MAFFFTMPISSTMPISAITVSSWPSIISASSAPMPAEGSVDRMVDRVDEALVEHAQHDVHHQDRRGQQQQLVGEVVAERKRGALERRADAGGHLDLALGLLITSTAAPSEAPGARLNDTVLAGNCAWWVISSGRCSMVTFAIVDSGTCPPPADGT